MERHCVGDATGARSSPLAKIAVYYTAHLARHDIHTVPTYGFITHPTVWVELKKKRSTLELALPCRTRPPNPLHSSDQHLHDRVLPASFRVILALIDTYVWRCRF